jgi:hypothetical protein
MSEEISQADNTRRVSRLLWIGLVFLGIGTGPLLIIILAAQLGFTRDPNPNPIGFGILAGFTFWPSLTLTVIGIVRTVRKRRAIEGS